ncbi:AMP-binding protein [Candidatus Cardinium hertigii]|jgi:acyl-CoA synthetase (AMP-forming)/AMP-acid ligase II|uniref:AMP-binding protein n=1 Tax=Candidatus Cardinium hertigii TaxID=247481 RepID=A0A3N2QBW7_9BACT|nr:AMP-binding protein [Candidatus Cardinium hertigii]ROT47275.1 AMP-binding protein [Candidatus Cardinium hertigii]
MHAFANLDRDTNKEMKKSYVHGCTSTALLFETIGQRMRMAATKFPDRTFVIFKREGIQKTYKEVLEDSEKLALGLIHLGMKQGDRVGIWAPNTYEWITTQFGAALAGLILVNVNPMYQLEDLSYALANVGIKVLIAPPAFKRSEYYKILCTLIPGLEHAPRGEGQVKTAIFPQLQHLILFDAENRVFNGTWSYSHVMQMGTDSNRMQLAQIEQNILFDAPANIQYTSGTTGKPKGAILTHHNIVNNAYFVGLRSGYHEKRSIICIPNPLYHCFGCVMGSLSALIHFQTCVFPAPSFEPLAALQAIDEEKCTAVYGTPTMFIDMMNHAEYPTYDYSSIISGIIAGAPCPVTLCTKLVNEFGMRDLQVCYGTTETSPVSFMSIREDPPEERIRNVGHIMDHLEAAIVDKAGKIVQRGEKGQVLVRGYSVMQGYWGDIEQSAITEDRWYHTGDIGVMHAQGTVSIVGRSKDMIVRGGENIYPTEVEQFLDKHPDIDDVQIIGVPDERFGEVVCAWIRLKQGTTTTEEDIRAYCQGKIAHFKIPKYIFFKEANEFPMTATGKIKKYKMRETSKQALQLYSIALNKIVT